MGQDFMILIGQTAIKKNKIRRPQHFSMKVQMFAEVAWKSKETHILSKISQMWINWSCDTFALHQNKRF